jgi:ferredoxin-type protein NapF
MHGGQPATVTRRVLFRRQVSQSAFRPPWAVDEASFQNTCDGCDKCVEKCPEKILKSTADGLVEVHFDDTGCTFCGECVSVCPTGALSKTIAPALLLKANVQGSCIALHGVMCRLCEEACEVVAIRFRPGLNGKSYPLIQDDACNGCGACVSRCPTNSILMAQQNDIKSEGIESEMGTNQ